MAIDLGDIPSGTSPSPAEKLQIRSAIGVGQTDAPTFFNILTSNSNFAVGSISGKNRIDGAGTVPYAIRFISNLDQLGGIKLGEDGINLGGTYLTGPNTDTLYQRNGLTAQNFWVANSVTNASPTTNYDRGVFGWSTNTLRIGTENGGTYTTARPIDFVTGGVARWQITAAGNLIASAENSYDIGLQNSNKPKNIFCGESFRAPYAYAQYGADGGLFFGANNTSTLWLKINAKSSGVVTISNSAQDNFDRLQLGNTTDSFPAIARDGAGIKFTGAAAGSTSWIKVPAVVVSALPSAATAGVGARSFVNNALTPVFGSAVTGGGDVTVPVYSTGSAWNVG